MDWNDGIQAAETWWSGLTPGTQDQVIGGLIGAVVLALAGLFRAAGRGLAQLWRRRPSSPIPEAISIYQAIGSRFGVAAAVANYGWAWHDRGNSEAARPYFQRALALFSEMGLEDRVERYRKLLEESDGS